MKKLLFSSLCAAALLTACNSEEPVINGGNNGALSEPQFLTVNLVANTTSGTRADGDYEAGLEAENKVSKVRFYFFDENGNAFDVKADGEGYSNWMDWEDISEEGDDMENVEKILSATLVIQSPLGDKVPSQLVAIINPIEEGEKRDLDALRGISKDYQTKVGSGEFVMSNSTYANNGTEIMAVSVADKIHKTSGEALADPVQIYVERTVAKVRLGSDLEPIPGMTNIFKTSKYEDDGTEVKQELPIYDENGNVTGSKEIYVQFLGWNTTAVAGTGRLIKDINTAWPMDLFGVGGGAWNWSDYRRSFWAINAPSVRYQYGAFVDNNLAANIFEADAKKKFDKSDWVYINENATPFNNGDNAAGADPNTKTKVIIAAKLVDSEGNAIEFAEYGSTRTSIDGLKVLFANNCGLYKKTTYTENGQNFTKFEKITPADLTIKTATAVGEASQTTPGRYKVYIQLAVNDDNTWYTSNNEDATVITAAAANARLKSLGSAKVWKDGSTYYYFDIKHLGNKYGVVRNHIYDSTVTKLAGLGTPVYDPEEIIYPEKPEDDDDTFIAAQINILSWRVVKNNVELEW